MDLIYEDLDDGVRRIRLEGRMDVDGAREIDLKLTTLMAARQAFVVIDLALVEFLSSIGLGTLVRSAKAQLSRHGKVVLLSPQPNVAKVLEMTQVDQILPVFYDFELARRAVAQGRTAPG
ncbi:MAG TPA: STAS domain-containing protein [Thermoanaerobaculia bacterium]|nr:STAS domain-containing protein [Thermoanaerobaculia bacterium]